LHSAITVIPWWTLQRPDHTGIEERTIAQYAEIYDAYFEERSLIPPGRLHEVRYESLVADPVGQLRAMYQALDMPSFDVAEPAIREYLATIKGYERNRFQSIQPRWKDEVATRWRRCFDEWGYAV
jgi:hypothetical protein